MEDNYVARYYSHQLEQHRSQRARGCFRLVCLLLALVFALLLFVILRRSGPHDSSEQATDLSAPESWSTLHSELLQQLRTLNLPDGAAEVIAAHGWTAVAATPPAGFAAAAAASATAALPSRLQAVLDFASDAAALTLSTNYSPSVTREQKRRATKAMLTADRYLAALRPLQHWLLCKLPLLRQAADYAAGWQQQSAQQGGGQPEPHAAAAEAAHQALLAVYAVLVADRPVSEAAARARHLEALQTAEALVDAGAAGKGPPTSPQRRSASWGRSGGSRLQPAGCPAARSGACCGCYSNPAAAGTTQSQSGRARGGVSAALRSRQQHQQQQGNRQRGRAAGKRPAGALGAAPGCSS
jgi:hypothetical protein